MRGLSPEPGLIDQYEITMAVNLSVRRELLPEPPLESWLRRHLIDRIPGAGHES